MRRFVGVISAIVASAVALAFVGVQVTLQVGAQARATATNVAIIPHESVANFFKLPPGVYTGENMGIATNSRGHIFIFHFSIFI